MRNQTSLARAKTLRTNQTPAEAHLWYHLRAHRFADTKFRRQKVVGPYIVDFASRNPMLVIEIDGDSHAESAAKDAARTVFLEQQGYQVVRFSNAEVLGNIEAVLGVIGSALAQMRSPLPDPLP